MGAVVYSSAVGQRGEEVKRGFDERVVFWGEVASLCGGEGFDVAAGSKHNMEMRQIHKTHRGGALLPAPPCKATVCVFSAMKRCEQPIK